MLYVIFIEITFFYLTQRDLYVLADVSRDVLHFVNTTVEQASMQYITIV